MARIRSIKPGFAGDSKVARLSLQARLTFILLWCEADDEGRMVASPKRLAGLLYPNDDSIGAKQVEKWVAELVKEEMVLLYNVDGTRYLHVTKFSDHQKPQHPTPSSLPPPDRMSGSRIPPERLTNSARAAHETLTPVLGDGEGVEMEMIPSSTVGPEPTTSDPPPWLVTLSPKLEAIDTTGTWDLIGAFADAWDTINDTFPPDQTMGNLIALTCDYIERVIGEKLLPEDRGRVAMLVRKHGKAALLGYDRALGATEDETPRARFVYARGVINRFIEEVEVSR